MSDCTQHPFYFYQDDHIMFILIFHNLILNPTFLCPAIKSQWFCSSPWNKNLQWGTPGNPCQSTQPTHWSFLLQPHPMASPPPSSITLMSPCSELLLWCCTGHLISIPLAPEAGSSSQPLPPHCHSGRLHRIMSSCGQRFSLPSFPCRWDKQCPKRIMVLVCPSNRERHWAQ